MVGNTHAHMTRNHKYILATYRVQCNGKGHSDTHTHTKQHLLFGVKVDKEWCPLMYSMHSHTQSSSTYCSVFTRRQIVSKGSHTKTVQDKCEMHFCTCNTRKIEMLLYLTRSSHLRFSSLIFRPSTI